MKKTNLLKSMLLLCALVAGSGSVWAASGDASWSFAITDKATDGSKLNTSTQTFTVDANHVWTYDVTVAAGTSPTISIEKYSGISGIRFGESGSKYYNPIILSTTAFKDYAVTKVRLYVRHNGSKKGTLTVKQGDITIGTATTAQSSAWLDVECSETNKGEGGTLSVKYEVAQAVYINKIEVWYEKTITFPSGKTMISFSDANNAMDFTTTKLPSGFAAYKVSAANASAVTLTAVNDVAKEGTGLILTGTANTSYGIPVVATGTDISATNLLVATDGESTVSNAAVLSDGAFHPLTSGVIAAGKAYLPYANIEGGDPFTGGAHALDIIFDNGDVTSIEQVANSQESWLNGQFYDLQGRKIAQPTKGLYIVNGKKVIIK